MKTLKLPALLAAAALVAGWAAGASAHGPGHQGGIATPAAKAVKAPFDIVHTKVSTKGNVAIFHMAVSGKAGKTRPTATGKLAGSAVFRSYSRLSSKGR